MTRNERDQLSAWKNQNISLEYVKHKAHIKNNNNQSQIQARLKKAQALAKALPQSTTVEEWKFYNYVHTEIQICKELLDIRRDQGAKMTIEKQLKKTKKQLQAMQMDYQKQFSPLMSKEHFAKANFLIYKVVPAFDEFIEKIDYLIEFNHRSKE